MKFKKIIAAAGAAAMVLGGVAIGASAASAAPVEVPANGTITINAANDESHNLTGYLLRPIPTPMSPATRSTRSP